MLKIAVQGAPGAFHDIVAHRYFGDDIELVCCHNFRAVFESLANKEADYGVSGIENSLYGSISEVYDLLLEFQHPIIGEEIEHVHQQLITLPETKLENISEVYSQVMALNQCRGWLETHLPQAELVEYHDTADAVRHVIELGSPYAAAIASRRAAEIYSGKIIAADIEDEKANMTRFVVLQPNGTPPFDANKVSLVLTLPHTPGSLYEALSVFNKYAVNLCKLESRPIRNEPFRYSFFIDAECDSTTLETIQREFTSRKYPVRLLGHYISAKLT